MFQNPIGLLALLGVPAVIALHMYRRRHRPQLVSALFLWDAASDAPTAGRRRERMLRSPSFWTELVAALLLALAFAGPSACADLRARHLVVVLDGSASMGAEYEGGGVRDEVALDIERELHELPSGSRVTLIESGARPRVLAGPGAFPSEAVARLDAWRPSAGRHDIGASVALALELAGEGAVMFCTDVFEADALPPTVELRAYGRALDNIAIARARRVRDAGGGERVLVTLASFCDVARRTTLTWSAEGAPPIERALELEAGERTQLELELPPGTPALELSLAADALAIDDRALLLPPPRRELMLATDLDIERALQLGLASRREGVSSIDRWLAIVPYSIAASDASNAHLAICTEDVASELTWSLKLHDAAGEREDFVGPFVVERAHPLLQGLTLEGVIWSAPTQAALPGTPLISAGDRPLMTEERDGNRLIVHMSLDPFLSTLQRAPDWPVLLANLAELRRDALPGPRRVDLVPGEPLVYVLESPGEFTLRGPIDGDSPNERVLAARELLVVDDLEAPGLYVLEREGREVARYALAFQDAAESDLRARSSGRRAAAAAAGELTASSSWLVQLASLFALALLLLDAWLLRRARL